MQRPNFSSLSKKSIATVLDIIQSFAISFTIYILIFHFIAQPQRVVSVSMQPSFYENDRLIVEKVTYRFGTPQRGDVIVFKYPENEEITLIKRIIALPGETILLKDSQVYINDALLSEPYLKDIDSTVPNTALKENTPLTLDPEEYIVMGDNRLQSGDSRLWGTVAKKDIIGQAVFRFWPINKIGIVQQPDSNI